MRNWVIYIAAAVGFAIFGAANKADRDGSGAIVGEGNVNAFQIRVGDCFDDSNSLDEVTDLPGVPCSQPHDNEAYAILDLTIASYPGGDGMFELANTACLERFEAFVGRDYDSSSLDIFALYPSQQSWKQDDREVVCAVYDMNAEKLEGSAKGRAL